MKRLLFILFMLLIFVSAHAEGPRYRFKSRRALQTLWRKEQIENSNNISNGRKLSVKELQGENAENNNERSVTYGVVVADPFSKSPMGGGMMKSSKPGGGVPVRGGGNTGGGIHPFDNPNLPSYPEPDDPFSGGTIDPNPGAGGYAPPKSPVGDGFHILLLFAAFVVIKKGLSK